MVDYGNELQGECKSVDYYPAMNLSYHFYKAALTFIWYGCNLNVLPIIYDSLYSLF